MKKLWINSKFKGYFIGRYSRFTVMKKDETHVYEFTFTLVSESGKGKPKTYNSYQDAKKDGWELVTIE